MFALTGMTFTKTIAQNLAKNLLPNSGHRLIKRDLDTLHISALLKNAEVHIKNKVRSQANRDSALLLCRQAEDLSINYKYEKGLEKSYDALIRTWMKIREEEIKSGKDGNIELQKTREAEDKLIGLLKKRQDLNYVGEKYLSIADYRDRAKHNLAERLRVCELALTAFKQSGNKKLESEALYEIGLTHHFLQNGLKAQEYYLQSIATGKSTGGRKLQHAHAGAGAIYRFNGDYKLALEHLLEAARIAEKRRDSSSHIGIINIYLGGLYEKLDQWDLAGKYHRTSLEIYEKYPETNLGDLTSAANNVAKIIMRKDPQAAITFLNSMLKKYPEMPTHEAYQLILNRFMQANLKLKNHTEGQKYCSELLKRAEGQVAPIQRSIYVSTIPYLIETGQYDVARKYLPAFQSAAEKTKELPYIRDASLYWHQVDSAQGNFKEALASYMKYKALNDSVYNDTKIREISQLQIQYETEKKDNDITRKEGSILLLTNEAKLQRAQSDKQEQDLELSAKNISLLKSQQELQQAEAEKARRDILVKDQDIKLKGLDISLLTKEGLLREARLRQIRTTRNIIIGGAAALLLLLGLLYKGYHAKQVTNKKINEQNLTLHQMVNEKEWLLKEVHHRVKNNLQTVVSLLESQSAYLQDEALLAVQDSQNRVYAMSLIHQKLYQTENVASINMATYLPELVYYLRDIFNVKHIFFNLHIASVDLDISQAIPVGLIVNEAITNSIKYAFPDDAVNRQITISMHLNENNLAELKITDNGVGLPQTFDRKSNNGLGLKLMQGLTEDIEGQFLIKSAKGTAISVNFIANTPLHKLKEASHSKMVITPA